MTCYDVIWGATSNTSCQFYPQHQPWVINYVRPKIRLTLQINHTFEYESDVGLFLELTSESRGLFSEDYEELSDTNPRCKLACIEWKAKTETNWEDLVLEMDDYPSGMRMGSVKILASVGDLGQERGPYIGTMTIQFIMPENPVLKPYLKSTEQEDDREFNRNFFGVDEIYGYSSDEEVMCPAKKRFRKNLF